MRSFFGSILLILVLAALGGTIYYHWATNSHLEFEPRSPDDPEKITEVIHIGQQKHTPAVQVAPIPDPITIPDEVEMPDALPVEEDAIPEATVPES